MSGSFSLRRIAVVGALALLGLAGPVSVARAGDFRASGTFVVVSTEANRFEIAHSGHSSPGGPFTGTVSGKRVANGTVQYGTGTIDFGGGDTLTYDWDLAFDPESGLLVGTYEITGGTGKLAGATGNGVLTVDPSPGGGEFEMAGTLSR